MLIVLTSSTDATADYLCEKLATTDIRIVRIDTDRIAERAIVLFDGDQTLLSADGERVNPSVVSNVWFRRPKPIAVVQGQDEAETIHRSGEWAEALEGFLAQIAPQRWVNHPAANSGASHKIEQLVRARSEGLSIPETIVTNDREKAKAFVSRHAPGLLIKPLASGYLERDEPEQDTLIYTERVTAEQVRHIDMVANCPVLLQKEIRKEADVRLNILDGIVRAVGLGKPDEDGGQLLDIRRGNMSGVAYEDLTPPATIVEKLRALVDGYGLRFAAIDMAIDQRGNWYFLEVNPNGQWAWLDLVGNQQLWQLFAEAFAE